jgi:hypothetical protein
MRRLKSRHPGARLSPIKGYIRYPGTDVYQEVVAGGFEPPRTLEGWSRLDWNSASRPWLTKRQARLVEKATYVTFGLNGQLLENSGMSSYPLPAWVLRRYANICKKRCDNGSLGLMPELPLIRAAKRLMEWTGWSPKK